MPESLSDEPSVELRLAAIEAAIRTLSRKVFADRNVRPSGLSAWHDPALDPEALSRIETRMYALLGG